MFVQFNERYKEQSQETRVVTTMELGVLSVLAARPWPTQLFCGDRRSSSIVDLRRQNYVTAEVCFGAILNNETKEKLVCYHFNEEVNEKLINIILILRQRSMENLRV